MENTLTTLMTLLAITGGTLTAAPQTPATRSLREVVVTAQRPMREIGAQITTVDSAALRESVALSMADVLAYNSGIFVKNHGRATLSTVSFRGTAPSHTQVTWNGMKINSPMLGATDFSTIPSFFIDKASLLHGATSVNEAGGGLGGMVKLGTTPDAPDGWGAQYVQGIGSFTTFDEFLRVTFHNDRWTSSTRAVLSTSPNDYKYTNRDKKLNVYDDDHNIVAQYHPVERNRSGAYRDLHLLQELYHNDGRGNRYGLMAWYANSRRELPLLTTDYADETRFENVQREQSLRAVITYARAASRRSIDAKAGYTHTHLAYDYSRDAGGGAGMVAMTRSRSTVHTVHAQGEGLLGTPDRKWLFTLNASAYGHFVHSEDRQVLTSEGTEAVGYDRRRLELSGAASAKWRPVPRAGLSAVIRGESAGSHAALIPAFFADAILLPAANLTARASITRNCRFPSLNDLYFMPGGNPDLKSEKGFTYDCGLSFDVGKAGVYALDGALSWFDSRIDDWILWLPTTKGFFSPRNVKKVHAYGVEVKTNLALQPHPAWLLELGGSFSWTPSVNCGTPMTEADKSVGRQLPYVPRRSASVTGTLSWRRWRFTYRWLHYSERFTMSSNEQTLSGKLPPYYMSNVSLGRALPLRWADVDLKLAVNNLFDEDYLSVLSRPMPGINFEFFVSITPHFTKR